MNLRYAVKTKVCKLQIMTQLFITLAAILGGLWVTAGAFATHALKLTLRIRAIKIFETTARYQMYMRSRSRSVRFKRYMRK